MYKRFDKTNPPKIGQVCEGIFYDSVEKIRSFKDSIVVELKDDMVITEQLQGKFEFKDGYAIFKDGELHNLNGPALVTKRGKEWWQNGKRHREDGPAIEYVDGTVVWYSIGEVVEMDESITWRDWVIVATIIFFMVSITRSDGGWE